MHTPVLLSTHICFPLYQKTSNKLMSRIQNPQISHHKTVCSYNSVSLLFSPLFSSSHNSHKMIMIFSTSSFINHPKNQQKNAKKTADATSFRRRYQGRLKASRNGVRKSDFFHQFFSVFLAKFLEAACASFVAKKDSSVLCFFLLLRFCGSPGAFRNSTAIAATVQMQ